MIQAVIFDMDGVLVDTFEAHFESWNVVAHEEGTAMTRQQFAETFGRTSREIIAQLWGQGGKLSDATPSANPETIAPDTIPARLPRAIPGSLSVTPRPIRPCSDAATCIPRGRHQKTL